MLEKWEKLEKLFNTLIEKLKLFIITTFFKIVPVKIIEKYKLTKKWLFTKSNEKFQQIITWKENQKELNQQRKESLKKRLEDLKAYMKNKKEDLKKLKKWRPRIPKKQDFIDFLEIFKKYTKIFL